MKKAFLLLFVMAILGIAKAQNYHWTPTSGYQYNMTVNGVILIDGVEQQLTTLQVGAFCGDESRAYSYCAQYFPPTNQYVVTVTILSDVPSGETITFRLYDQVNDKELDLDCVNTVTFESNTSIPPSGMTDWFELAFVTPTPPITGFHFNTAGNWNTASNWQGGALPTASDEVFIDASCDLNINAEVANLTISDGALLTLKSGNTLTVTGTLTNTVASRLVIEDGAQLLNTSANVAATVEKDITAFLDPDASDGWYTIASPVDDMEIAGSDFLTETYDLYRFVETNQNQDEWENYRAGHADFTFFENGRGYLYANSNTFSPVFSGVLNNASIKYSLTCTNRPGDDLDGFNLIGNPFPHNIYKGAGGAIDDANLASGFYTLTNEGAWHVHVFNDAILPGQGFLVKTSTNTKLVIDKTNSKASSETSSKAVGGLLEIGVSGMGCEDRSFVFFTPGLGLDKMRNLNESLPSLFVRNEGGDYAISHVGTDCESLELNFHNSKPGHFVIETKTEGVRFNYLHLIDRVTGANIDLLQTSQYNFNTTGHENADRFMLAFKVMTGVNEITEDALFAFISDGQIIITGVETSQSTSLQVVDATGRVIVTRRDEINAISTEGIAPGVYVLRLVNDNKVRTQKIVVK